MKFRNVTLKLVTAVMFAFIATPGFSTVENISEEFRGIEKVEVSTETDIKNTRTYNPMTEGINGQNVLILFDRY